MPGPSRSLTNNWTPRRWQALARSAQRIAAGLALAIGTQGTGLAEQVSAARVWPAPEYTRVAIEAPTGLTYSVFAIGSPERLVVDLENIELGPALEELPTKVAANDPYIAAIRIGRFRPGVIRLVFDLKQSVNAQVFTLKPVADYGHRLVLDLYPLVPIDPILALLQEKDAASRPAPAPSHEGRTAQPHAPGPGPEPAQPKAERMLTVAIDAGHGGEDPGAKGRRGTYEKHVTLEIARKLKKLVDQEPNMRGVLIRDGDYFIPLAKRVEKARKLQADMFVSIHADAYTKPHARGSSVFALSERGATSAMAALLATKENEADLIGGVNIDVDDPLVKQVLLDLSQTVTLNDSLKVARAVLDELESVNTLHKSQVEQAGFAVLKAPDIPSILVETAFLTNPEEERKLRDETYQQKVAAAILSGVKKYFSANPPVARSKLAQN